MDSKFSNQLKRSNEVIRFLPLFHTCSGLVARDHMDDYGINTDDVCEVFDEKITYLFYGRAAFKYDPGEENSRQLTLYPVCFVFDLELLEGIKRIYPFDTGAMHHGLLKDFIHKKIAVADFELEPQEKRISDIILQFFDNNENYLASSENGEVSDPLHFESVALREMARSYASGKADERRVTIEVQAGEAVPFSGGSLIGMIVPMQYLDSATFMAFRDKSGIKVATYAIDVWNPKQSFGVLAGAAKRFLVDMGYVSERT